MTEPDDRDDWDPGDLGYDDWDPVEMFPPGTSLAELAAFGLRRVRDLRPDPEVL